MSASRFSLMFPLALCALLLSSTAFAQEYAIRGRVVDESESALPGVLVRLVDLSDSSKSYVTSTNLDGTFLFSNILSHSYHLKLEAVGRKDFSTTVRVAGRNNDIGNLVMNESAIHLRGVTVEGRVPSAIQNGDTTEFQAVAVKMNRDATMEDLLSKLPGVIVSNGTVTVGGETVQRVLIDGKPYFGDDPTIAIRNLPAEVIDKIQVFDQMSDQAQFTGFDDGQSVKAINVVTRRNGANLNFGKFTAGYGDDDGRYDAAANMNMFDGNSRVSLLGSSNNVNQQDFSTQDILGVVSTNSQLRTPGAGAGSGGNGPRRVNPFGRSGGTSSNNQLVGQQPGVNNTSILGANASDSLEENLFAQGSYFFNRVGNQNNQLDHRQNLLGGDSTSLYDANSNVSSTNYNNRINSRIDYSADPSNKLTILPVLYFQSNRANNILNDSTIENNGGAQSQSNTNALNNGYNLTGHAVYRHAFDLPGRTISLDVGAGANQKHTNELYSASDEYYGAGASPNDSISQQQAYLSNAETASANLIYTEPTDINARVELLYNSSFTHGTAYQNTYNFDPVTGEYTDYYAPLSNSYADNYITQKAGIGYLWRSASPVNSSFGGSNRGGFSSAGWNIMANLSYQYAEMSGDDSTSTNMSIMKKFYDFLPSLLINYTSSDHKNLRIFYRTSTTAPAVTQLQPVINNSNQLLLTTGNPNLSESYSQTLLARYNLTAPGQAQSMFLLLFATYTNDYIANATVIPSRDTVLSNGTTMAPGTRADLSCKPEWILECTLVLHLRSSVRSYQQCP